MFFREEASRKPHGVCFSEEKQAENPQQADSIQRNSLQTKIANKKSQTKNRKQNHKQKIPHFIHSHLEAKGNRWYNLKDCMKTKPRQLKKSFSDTGSVIKSIIQKVAFSVVSESDCRKNYFKENLLCTRSLRWNLPEEPCVSM